MPPSRGALWIGVLPALLLLMVAVAFPLGSSAATAISACLSGLDCKELWSMDYRAVWVLTLKLSLGTALWGVVFGLAVAIALRECTAWIAAVERGTWLAAQFAGVPLALSCMILFGAQGWAVQWFGVSPFSLGSELSLWWGYAYFQSAMGLLLLVGPVTQLPQHLVDASDVAGATRWRFWVTVGGPMLGPTVVEAFALLVANAAAAHATPFALAGTSADVMAVRLTTLLSGDPFQDPRWVHVLSTSLLLLLMAVVLGGRWMRAHLARRDVVPMAGQ